MTTNFADYVQFLHAFDIKFTINTNIVYTAVNATFSMSIMCPNHYGQYFLQLKKFWGSFWVECTFKLLTVACFQAGGASMVSPCSAWLSCDWNPLHNRHCASCSCIFHVLLCLSSLPIALHATYGQAWQVAAGHVQTDEDTVWKGSSSTSHTGNTVPVILELLIDVRSVYKYPTTLLSLVKLGHSVSHSQTVCVCVCQISADATS